MLFILITYLLIIQIHLFESSVLPFNAKLTMSISLIQKQLQYIELDFKSGNLFLKCSVATDLVTSHQFHSSVCYHAVLFLLANYGAIPYSLIFTPIAALLQAVLQAIMEPFRNGLVETRNWTVKTIINHNTGPKRSKMMMEYGLGAWNMNFAQI